MNRTVPYNAIDRKEWSRLVRESRTGTWFQSPDAYAFLASQTEVMEAFAIGLTDEAERLRGVCVGYVTKEHSALKQWFSRRAIINGGACLADDCRDEEVRALMAAVCEHLKGKAIYIETRNFNDYSHWRKAFEEVGFSYQPHLNFHIDCSDRETMYSKMSDVRRRQVKKAINSGAIIKSEGITETEITAFYEILSRLYRTKVKTPLFPLEFFLSFHRNGAGKYLLVQYEGKVIGGMMCPILTGGDNPAALNARGCIYEWYVCGMDSEYKDQYPSVMATYAAMDYASSNGLARFDVMGAGQPGVPYGVRDFKSEFGGQLVEHGRFVNIQYPMLYRLGSFVVKRMKKLL